MEIAQYFEDKTVFISGVTGFLAKLFLEKILRIQPKVKKIFLLIRATSEKSVEQRLHDEVLSVELFRIVKKDLDSNAGLLEKVVPIPGDVSLENLGIIESRVREEIWRDVDIIVNSAATTKFDERYDVALGINAMGGMHVQHFAAKCCKLEMLLHVSTAYIHGMRDGLILEQPIHMGETLPGAKISYLDINMETKIVEKKLRELQALNATQKEVTWVMKEMGIDRAKLHGWPNTYAFTKAMGEMMILEEMKRKDYKLIILRPTIITTTYKEPFPGWIEGLRAKLHGWPNTYAFTKAMGEMMILEEMKGKDYKLIILRPTIITSTYREPFPGWIEGLRTLDALFAAYGKGKLTFFLADPQSIVDIVS
ncbi:UNVERIFIED_CONTAM: putative fatty acyl-CoA reductase 4 [Sesamum indicum]